MKRVNLFLVAAFVAASAMFFGCGEETEEDNPKIDVRVTYGNVNKAVVEEDETIEQDQGTMLVFDIAFTMGKSALTNVKMYSKIGSRARTLVLDSVLNEGLINLGSKVPINFQYVTYVGLEEEELTFEAVDKKPRTSTFSFNLKQKTVELPPAVADPIYFAEGVITLGGNAHTSMGSFYSVSLGKVYLLSGAKVVQNDIDFAYYHQTAPSGNYISGPNDAGTNYGTTANNLSTWSKKKITSFAKVMSGATVNSSTSLVNIDKEEWGDAMAEVDLPAASKKTDALANGDVYAFKTEGASGTKGAFVVTNMTGTAAGTISIRFITEVK